MANSQIHIRITEISKKHKEQDRSVSCNFFILILAIAGLVVTLQEWYRGDKSLFLYAFIASIVASGAEILINICLLCRKKLKGDGSNDPFGSPCYIATVQILYIVGGCIAFCMLVIALAESDGVETSEACGCANGFGCANILAICGIFVIYFCINFSHKFIFQFAFCLVFEF